MQKHVENPTRSSRAWQFHRGCGEVGESRFQVLQKCSASEVTWAFYANDHLTLSGVLGIPRKQQPCSPSSERATTPALASVQLTWIRELICLKNSLFWVVILLDWISDLAEPTPCRPQGAGKRAAGGVVNRGGTAFFPLSYACIPTWNESVGGISFCDETHWPPGLKFGILVPSSAESKPWTKKPGFKTHLSFWCLLINLTCLAPNTASWLLWRLPAFPWIGVRATVDNRGAELAQSVAAFNTTLWSKLAFSVWNDALCASLDHDSGNVVFGPLLSRKFNFFSGVELSFSIIRNGFFFLYWLTCPLPTYVWLYFGIYLFILCPCPYL